MFTGFQGEGSLLEIVGTFFPANELQFVDYCILYIMELKEETKEETKGTVYVIDGKEWIVGEQKISMFAKAKCNKIKEKDEKDKKNKDKKDE